MTGPTWPGPARPPAPRPPLPDPMLADGLRQLGLEFAGFALALALLLALLALAGCGGTRPPPYGLLTYEHTHTETLDTAGRVVARSCHTHVEGGVETAGAALQGQSCGDTIGGTTEGITAFEGQRIGAPLYLAKIQADAARDQALIAGGYQLGQIGICAGMLGASAGTAGAALPAAAASCLQALRGMAPTPAKPTPVPAPPVLLPPPLPSFPTPAPGDGGDSGGNSLAPRHHTGAAPGTVSPLQAFLESRTLQALESPEP